MKRDLVGVDMKLLEEEAHTAWMKDLKKLKTSLDRMQNSESIEDLRTEFSNLSNALSGPVENYGWNTPEEDMIYLEYCPMANKDQGGYWLSFDDQIRNPYFGEQMLNCGEVVRTFSK